MISKKRSRFEFNDRGHEETCVLVPGWACDYRVFNNLDMPYNYIQCLEYNPFNFSDPLRIFIDENNIKHLSLLGWSMGGYCAINFCKEYKDPIDRLILCAMKFKYGQEMLDTVKLLIRKNRPVYLTSFFKQCLASNEENEKIDKNLLHHYCEKSDEKSLLNGLEFLSRNEMSLQNLDNVNSIVYCHGIKDAIAPYKEMEKFDDLQKTAKFIIIDEGGHLPFLTSKFTEELYMIS